MVVRSVVCEGGGGGGGGGCMDILEREKGCVSTLLKFFSMLPSNPSNPVPRPDSHSAQPTTHHTHANTHTQTRPPETEFFSSPRTPHSQTHSTPPHPPHHTTPHHTITCICSLALPALSLPHRIPLTQRHPRNNVSLTTLIT